MPTSALWAILLEFSPAFRTSPTFRNFTTLLVGWLLCNGRHTISRVIQFCDRGKRHHSSFYRFFSRAKWQTDALGRVVLKLVLPFAGDGALSVLVDDTLCRKNGPHLWGAGMHHDPLTSTYGGGRSRTVNLAFGHCWVTLSVWIPFPWNPDRGLAVPFMWRLYRNKKRCPAAQYRKKTELANEMLAVLLSWLPAERSILLTGDAEYACRPVVRNLTDRVTFIGPMDMDAAFFATPSPEKGRGRPPKKGPRLPSPKALAADESIPWKKCTVRIYSRDVAVLVKTQLGLWYTVAGTRLVRMIVTRDPKGRIADRAYFSTNPKHGIGEIATAYSRRWTQEVMHRDVKQHLGLEDPQNGWWRHPGGSRADRKRAGPNPHETKGALAVEHTVPLAFVTYAAIVVWYLRRGFRKEDVERVKKRAPWYRRKVEPAFSDMLAAARLDLWAARLSKHPSLRGVSESLARRLPEFLLVA
jgi:DDE superfamily endonuclease